MNKEKCEEEWILENKGNKLGSSRKIERKIILLQGFHQMVA